MSDKAHKFVTLFDSLGFECIVDITTYENQVLLATLRDINEHVRSPVDIRLLVMRAQANPQRSPEIWTFTAKAGINEGILLELATDSPQGLADLIRKHGTCVWRIEQTQPTKRVII